jgi:hypothetical protein
MLNLYENVDYEWYINFYDADLSLRKCAFPIHLPKNFANFYRILKTSDYPI